MVTRTSHVRPTYVVWPVPAFRAHFGGEMKDVIDARQKLTHDVKQYFRDSLPPTSDRHSRVDIAGRV